MQISNTLPESVASRQGARSTTYDELATTLVANPGQCVIVGPKDMPPVTLVARSIMIRQAMRVRGLKVMVLTMSDTDSVCVSLKPAATVLG